MNKRLNIFVSPLEWGLGHAGRMIPLVRNLRAKGHNVFIGSGEEHLAFFRKEIPGLKYIVFPGFRIRYSGWLPQYLVIIVKIPMLLYHSIREHARLKKIIREHSVDIVISDSRIGLWNNKVKSVLVMHFPRIPFPYRFRFMEKAGICLSKLVIKKFSYCYIPDLEGRENLTGKLSHDLTLPVNARFIGILSRFSNYAIKDIAVSRKFRYLVILSGPEPQKGILKKKLFEILSRKNEQTIILGADPSSGSTEYVSGKITYLKHLPEEQMAQLLLSCDMIITRSGYTTIMELVSINRSAILIPTPGQTEQEYLAQYLSDKSWFTSITQKELNDLAESEVPKPGWPSDINLLSEKLLEKALAELLE